MPSQAVLMPLDAKAEIASLQSQLQACTTSLEAANKDLEMICYAIAHDLRAPLRAVDGFSRMLLNRCRDRFDAEDLRLMGVVRSNSATMHQLIEDIVSYARLHRKPLRHSDIDMAALVAETWADLAEGYAGSFELPALPQATGDRALLKEVWLQLLANALKFSAGQPAPRIAIDGEQRADEVVYRVHDNGVGFDMTYAHKLFMAFQRLHAVTDFPGNGIGLAKVARIVSRHGGTVGAKGVPAQGATFWFTLPIQPDPAPVLHSAES
jgi:light-regulated signal transduction histidine kinase (bacteriophytochrome)